MKKKIKAEIYFYAENQIIEYITLEFILNIQWRIIQRKMKVLTIHTFLISLKYNLWLQNALQK